MISANLAGAEHRFRFAGYQFVIRLPKRLRDSNAITCTSYRVRRGRKIPLQFEVHQLDVLVEMRRRVRIRSSAIGRVDVSQFPPGERRKLDPLAKKAELLMDSAFDHWVSVLRWKTGIVTACQSTALTQRTNWGTYLLETGTERRFYAPAHVIHVERRNAVKRTAWQSMQRALSKQDRPPIWRQYYASANQKLVLNDVRGFILELAIAIETLTRQLMNQLLRQPATSGLERLFGFLPLTRVLEEWPKVGFSSTDWQDTKQDRAVLKTIVDKRNAIMHRGELPKMSTSENHEFLAALQWFMTVGEKELARKKVG